MSDNLKKEKGNGIPAVRVKCNSFTYMAAEEPVLRDIDFHISYGEVTLLFGQSGCGKSTLLSLINGVIPRMTPGTLDGEVLIDGEDTAGRSMSQISRKVGSVLQNAESQIIHQRVDDEIAFGCENFGVESAEIGRRVEENCKRMKLAPDWKTRTLSGGQKQRVITASTLAMDAPVIIFDEPLANLDGAGARDLLSAMRDLAAAGKAVLLVEHRLDVVMGYVDTAWIMEDGSVRPLDDMKAYLKSQVGVIAEPAGSDITKPGTAFALNDVVKTFGKREIIRGLSGEIPEGSRTLLLGENGCGKSTLMSMIARLAKPDGGRIEAGFSDDIPKRADKRWFQLVGVIYQNPNYQLFMPSVREEFLFGCADEAYGLALADRLGLTPLLERHPHSLSEGQKRRVTVAAILAQRPRVLLLDEPTVGQDYAGLQSLVEVLCEVHKEEHNTMITVTHDFRCAKALCDHALWIRDGVVAKSGGKELVEEYFSADR